MSCWNTGAGKLFKLPVWGCKTLDVVFFHYGYTRKTMTFCIDSIRIGKGRPEWGGPDEDVFIVRLGKRIN